MFQVKKVLIIDVMAAGIEVRDMFVKHFEIPANDVYQELLTEFSPSGDEKYGDTLNWKNIRECEQENINSKYPIDTTIEQWILKQNIDLSDIDQIMVQWSW